ncbi:hypothetical protein GCM10020227_61650 [Streptomyces flavovirens]
MKNVGQPVPARLAAARSRAVSSALNSRRTDRAPYTAGPVLTGGVAGGGRPGEVVRPELTVRVVLVGGAVGVLLLDEGGE